MKPLCACPRSYSSTSATKSSRRGAAVRCCRSRRLSVDVPLRLGRLISLTIGAGGLLRVARFGFRSVGEYGSSRSITTFEVVSRNPRAQPNCCSPEIQDRYGEARKQIDPAWAASAPYRASTSGVSPMGGVSPMDFVLPMDHSNQVCARAQSWEKCRRSSCVPQIEACGAAARFRPLGAVRS